MPKFSLGDLRRNFPMGGVSLAEWRNGGKHRGILKSQIRCISFGILGANIFFWVLFRAKFFFGYIWRKEKLKKKIEKKI